MGMGKRWNFFFHILPPGFGPKLAIFPTFFFLANIGQENVFYYILEALNVPQRTSTYLNAFPSLLSRLGCSLASLYKDSFMDNRLFSHFSLGSST